MGIKKEYIGYKFWEVQEGIIGNFLSILGVSLTASNNCLVQNGLVM